MNTNCLITGDNLEIMQSMESGSVDLICTDPPFNTGKDWGEFDDKWEGGLKGYLKFMEERCVEMHRLLKDTGSLYLHCDPTASHYLKVMLDNVFGIKQFRNEIVWHYSKWTNTANKFQLGHNTILYYTKSDKQTFNREYVITDYIEYLHNIGHQTNRIRHKGRRVTQLIVYDIEKSKHLIDSGKYEKIAYCTDKKGALRSDSWTAYKPIELALLKNAQAILLKNLPSYMNV